jgi:hypothetical protein
MAMIRSRNLTSHTYNPEFANEIAALMKVPTLLPWRPCSRSSNSVRRGDEPLNGDIRWRHYHCRSSPQPERGARKGDPGA